MKHSRTQFTAFLLAAALACLAGCAGGTAPSAASAPAAPASSAPPAPGSLPGPSSQLPPMTDDAPQYSEPPRYVVPGISAGTFPALDGSTATMPLMAHLYSALCDVPVAQAAEGVAVSQTSEAWQRILFGTGSSGLVLLVYQAPPTFWQENLYRIQQELEVTPIGSDALVFLANGDNPVPSLAQDQLRGIFEGRIADWGEVGGRAGQPIDPVHRNWNSGSRAMFDSLLYPPQPQAPGGTDADGAPADEPPDIPIVDGMGALIDTLLQGSGVIGYSVYYYAQEMHGHEGLRMVPVDGVAPSPETIADGSYPLTSSFYAVIRADEPEDSPARLLHNWLLTEEGRQLLEWAGYMPKG